VFGALDRLVEAGKIRYYGVSVERVEEALKAIEFPNVQTVQIIFNCFRHRPADLFFEQARKKQVGILARVPLASGMLTGKLTRNSQFAADDHRNFNRHGEAFDVGETFSGVDYETALEAVEEIRRLAAAGRQHGAVRAALDSDVRRRHVRHPRRQAPDLGSEFVYMAATLIHIKSKMLLPRDPALGKEEDASEDPRQELVDRLLEHERFKNAAEMLQQKRLIEENVWSNPQIKQFTAEDEDPGLAVTLFELVKAFGEVLERKTKNRPIYEVETAEVTVAEMVRYLGDEFERAGEGKPVFILRVFERQHSRRAMIALFLAVLELIRMRAIAVTQKDLFGEIALERHVHFDRVMASDEPMAAIEKDYI
jgi:segregation and condensation protein A